MHTKICKTKNSVGDTRTDRLACVRNRHHSAVEHNKNKTDIYIYIYIHIYKKFKSGIKYLKAA